MERAYLFLQNKLKKRIEWSNETYTFTRAVEDKYHRKQAETISIEIKGLYHQTSSYQQKTSKDGSITTNRPKPMILCLYDEGSQIQKNDKTVVNGTNMLVTDIVDVQNLHVALQISLEPEE